MKSPTVPVRRILKNRMVGCEDGNLGNNNGLKMSLKNNNNNKDDNNNNNNNNNNVAANPKSFYDSNILRTRNLLSSD